MFNIKQAFIDDKNVPKVMWLLDGLVHDLLIIPVRGAQIKSGKVKSTQAIPGGSLADQVANHLIASKIDALGPGALKNVIVEVGGSPGSYGHVLKALRKAKLVGSKRKDGYYPVNPPK